MCGFDGPLCGLRFAPWPDLAPEEGAAALRSGECAGLKHHRVPAARLPGEGDRLGEVGGYLRWPGAQLQLLAGAHQVEGVTLRDEAHVGHAGHLQGGRIAKGFREGVCVAGGGGGGGGGGIARLADAGFGGAKISLHPVVVEVDRADPAL